MTSLFQLDIPKRSLHCFHKGEQLLPGMEIYSLLLEHQVKQPLRRDFCSSCWTQVQAEEEKMAMQVYWKSKIEQRKPSVDSSRLGRALALLQKLQQASEPQEEELFVLCLFLAHARQLILRQEFQKEGMTYQFYEILRKEEFITVKVIPLSQIQIEALQQSLADQLQPS